MDHEWVNCPKNNKQNANLALIIRDRDVPLQLQTRSGKITFTPIQDTFSDPAVEKQRLQEVVKILQDAMIQVQQEEAHQEGRFKGQIYKRQISPTKIQPKEVMNPWSRL